MLNTIKDYGTPLPEDIAKEFPGDEVMDIETNQGKVKFGSVEKNALLALEDLVNDKLVVMEVKPFEIEIEATTLEAIKMKKMANEMTPEMEQNILSSAVNKHPAHQGDEYWCLDETGKKMPLSNHGVNTFLTLSDSGNEVWNSFQGVNKR